VTELFVALVLVWAPMDGDSFRVLDARVWPEQKYEGRVRLLRVEAPELRGVPECEKALAVVAAQYTAEKLTAAKKIILRANSKDSFGRILAEVEIDGLNLNDHLLTSGKPFRPYGTAGAWC
jgi:micrococcal nuclease